MIVFIDTSVILRRLFNDPKPLKKWGTWTRAYASRIWRVEALRVADRIRMEGRIDDSQVASLREQIDLINETLILVPVSETVLARSSDSFPTVIGTLDAIHLSSALLLKPSVPFDLFLTHDKQLATAAQSFGFHVAGDD